MPDVSEKSLIPAAQYLRMSREHQRYSVRNQARAIAAYAEDRGFKIVKTYIDRGKSGLTLSQRPGLQALLSDVLKPQRAFNRVLVLDVSRWGRFQNLDQSSHYEFICFEAGVPIAYCAELFENDGSPISALLKQIKRLQAAEFSRELSEKVIHGQRLQARIGHKIGGPRRFGFDRILVDERGRPIQKLEKGQSKALSSHRVIYAIGSDAEVKVVRDIFRWYVRDALSMRQIALRLTAEGVTAGDREGWSDSSVRSVLTNELVLGFYTFNRTSQRLKTKQIKNPPEHVIRTKVTEPIISKSLFDSAARRLAIRRHGASPDENLKAVTRLFHAKGYLSGELINKCSYTQSTTVLREQFGSLQNVYQLVGFAPLAWYPRTEDKPLTNDQILERLRAVYESHGYINQELINATCLLPAVSTLTRLFGKLSDAYRSAGIPSGIRELQKRGIARRKTLRTGQPFCEGSASQWAKLPDRYSNESLLECLRQLHQVHGHVTAHIIRADENAPSVSLFASRFGSLLNAYRAAGIECRRSEIWRQAQRTWRMRAAPTGMQLYADQ